MVPDFLEGANHLELACVFMDSTKNDDFLQAANLVTPRAREDRRGALLESLSKQVQRQRRKVDTMLITSEHFQSRLTSNREVGHFVDSIKEYFTEIRVICYLRPQERMALSFYTQKLRGGFVPPFILPILGIRKCKPNLPDFFDFESLLDRWASAVGHSNVTPYVYERSSLVSGNVIADFFERIGCTLPNKIEERPVNRSYDAAGQLAMLTFNRLNFERRDEVAPTREKLDRFLQGAEVGTPLLPPRSEAEEFNTAFIESNRRVAQKWFGRDDLFNEPGLVYPTHGTDPPWEDATRLLAKFLSDSEAA